MEQKWRLSDGEWKVMRALWEHGSCSLGRLVELLRDGTGWSKSTVHIMLSRMAEKGAVAADAEASPKLYRPLLEREQAALGETRSFLSKVYGGSIGSMMTCMADGRALSREDIEELYAILRAAEEKA